MKKIAFFIIFLIYSFELLSQVCVSITKASQASNTATFNFNLTNAGSSVVTDYSIFILPTTGSTGASIISFQSGGGSIALPQSLGSATVNLISGATSVNFQLTTVSGEPSFVINNTSSISVSICNSSVSLPVELLNFQAQNQDKINVLAWQTASEKDNAGFDIQRSSEGKNFETLGFMKGNGTTQEKQSYSFIDEHPLSISYYRLRQIDLDGKEAFSKTVSVTMDLKTSFKIYPNPTNSILNIQFDSEKEQDTQIQLFDNLGRTVHTYNFTSKMGNNHLFFDTQSFPAGHYALIIKQGDLIVVNKIILN
jgi:Secretion system C-terminal sorting domain